MAHFTVSVDYKIAEALRGMVRCLAYADDASLPLGYCQVRETRGEYLAHVETWSAIAIGYASR
jgi:hypothetical protein